jgi:DNA-nicking Smr family endonuclease
MAKLRIESQVTQDEAQTFRAAVSDVKPLAHTPPPAGLVPTRQPAARARRRAPAAAGVHDGADIVADVVDVARVEAEDYLEFRRPGVRDQVLRRLKRGRFPIEGELDLHGLNQAAARELLADYLAAQRESGRRCLRIIHGKGYRSGARGPVLKSAANDWLRRHPDVMAFVSARPLDGGAGAVYVLLRA